MAHITRRSNVSHNRLRTVTRHYQRNSESNDQVKLPLDPATRNYSNLPNSARLGRLMQGVCFAILRLARHCTPTQCVVILVGQTCAFGSIQCKVVVLQSAASHVLGFSSFSNNLKVRLLSAKSAWALCISLAPPTVAVSPL
jgi:hypothetical protein